MKAGGQGGQRGRMADQGGAQTAAEAAAEAARVAELGRQLYEASDRGQATEVARLLGGRQPSTKGGIGSGRRSWLLLSEGILRWWSCWSMVVLILKRAA
jgi:hypothetical protein